MLICSPFSKGQRLLRQRNHRVAQPFAFCAKAGPLGSLNRWRQGPAQDSRGEPHLVCSQAANLRRDQGCLATRATSVEEQKHGKVAYTVA